MRRSLARFTFLALAMAGAYSAAAQECLKADDKAEISIQGTLAIVRFQHPGNGSWQTAYVVRLAKPVCADIADMDSKTERVKNIARVQLAGEFDQPKLKRLMNKRVTASGTGFAQHTAYHITPFLLSLKSIDAAK